MRKVRKPTIWGLLLPLLLFCGCAERPPDPPASPLAGHSGNYETEAVIHLRELTMTASISRSPQACHILFSGPESLAGMEYVFDRDSVELLYRGLQFQFDPQAVPDSSVAGVLAGAVDRVLQDDGIRIETADTTTQLSGMLDAGAFTLLVDNETAIPLKLLLPGMDMEIEFAQFRFLD